MRERSKRFAIAAISVFEDRAAARSFQSKIA